MIRKGFIRDEHSGALLAIPTNEEAQIEKLKYCIRILYNNLPETKRNLLSKDSNFMEVIGLGDTTNT